MSDLISRQDAIDALADYIHNVDRVYSTGLLSTTDCMDAARSVLDDLPSANQDLSGYSDRLWKSAYERGYERCRQDAIDAMERSGLPDDPCDTAVRLIEVLPSAQQWIPVKYRPMDEEEREYWSEQFGYDIEYEDAVMFDCRMPDDGQEILVSYRGGWVSTDICEVDGGLYGLEGNGDWDGVTAWMPLPEPYKEEPDD